MRLRPGVLLLLAAAVACDDEVSEAPPAPDAGPAYAEVRSPEAGLAFRLPPPWRLAPQEAAEPKLVDGPATRSLALLRRSGEASSVPPRVELTIEPAGRGSPEAVFARVLADLERIGDRPGVTVERAGFISRTLGSSEAADIRLRYRVGEPGVRIHQRSLLVLRPEGPGGARSLVTLSSSYLEPDEARVEAELERMFERIELLEPAPATARREEDGDDP